MNYKTMSSLGDSEFTICTQCNLKILSYSGQHQICRRQFIYPLSKKHFDITVDCNIQVVTSGNSKFDEFIKETQNNSKYCGDFIEWIPNNYLENVEDLTKEANSEIFCGNWNLTNLTIPLAIKVIEGSDEEILNEVKKEKI
jgi:hypothetical protein